MSQSGIINTQGGTPPPTVPTSFVADTGIAVPAANILNVPAIDSIANNANGITTTGSGNTLTTVLTNRLQGTATTVGTGTADVITFTPTVVGTYSIEYRTAAFNTTSTLGSGYSFFGAVRYNGVTAVICDAFDEINNEEGAMTAVGLDVVVSGANIILRATGYAAQTINWSSVGLYTFVGA